MNDFENKVKDILKNPRNLGAMKDADAEGTASARRTTSTAPAATLPIIAVTPIE